MHGSWPASDQGSRRSDGDERFGDLGELLIVVDEAAVLEDPCKGALHDPSAWQDLEALGACAPADDLERDVWVLSLAHFTRRPA